MFTVCPTGMSGHRSLQAGGRWVDRADPTFGVSRPAPGPQAPQRSAWRAPPAQPASAGCLPLARAKEAWPPLPWARRTCCCCSKASSCPAGYVLSARALGFGVLGPGYRCIWWRTCAAPGAKVRRAGSRTNKIRTLNHKRTFALLRGRRVTTRLSWSLFRAPSCCPIGLRSTLHPRVKPALRVFQRLLGLHLRLLEQESGLRRRQPGGGRALSNMGFYIAVDGRL